MTMIGIPYAPVAFDADGAPVQVCPVYGAECPMRADRDGETILSTYGDHHATAHEGDPSDAARSLARVVEAAAPREPVKNPNRKERTMSDVTSTTVAEAPPAVGEPVEGASPQAKPDPKPASAKKSGRRSAAAPPADAPPVEDVTGEQPPAAEKPTGRAAAGKAAAAAAEVLKRARKPMSATEIAARVAEQDETLKPFNVAFAIRQACRRGETFDRTNDRPALYTLKK